MVLVRLMLSCRSHRRFHPIGAGLLLAALVWFETTGAGSSLVVLFRISWCWPVVGRVGLIKYLFARWQAVNVSLVR